MIPDKVLNDIVRDLIGEDIIPLVQIIKGKTDVSEFKVAERLGLTVNKIRNMFYRLEEHSLVDFTRKKDKKKGWYVYFWTLDLFKLKNLALRKRREMVAKLRERVQKESHGEFFLCPDKHIRVNLENAMEHGFRCPECNLALQREDNQKTIANIQKQISRLTDDIQLLESLDIKPLAEKKTERVKEKPKKKEKEKVKKVVKKIVKRKFFKGKSKHKAKKKFFIR